MHIRPIYTWSIHVFSMIKYLNVQTTWEGGLRYIPEATGQLENEVETEDQVYSIFILWRQTKIQ